MKPSLTVLTFGKFKGAVLADVNKDYLKWVVYNAQNIEAHEQRDTIIRFLQGDDGDFEEQVTIPKFDKACVKCAGIGKRKNGTFCVDCVSGLRLLNNKRELEILKLQSRLQKSEEANSKAWRRIHELTTQLDSKESRGA